MWQGLEGSGWVSSLEAMSREKVSKYLSNVFGDSAQVLSIGKLGSGVLGFAYLVDAKVKSRRRRIVLKFANPSGFGQDFPSDRADTLIYANSVYNRLPRHVRAFDVGAVTEGGDLKTLGDTREFFILMEYAQGQEYAKDLDRIMDEGKLLALDVDRAQLLAEYMAKIHKVKHDAPGLYIRRIRDLIGRGDCIAGIIDSYPKDERTYSFTSEEELEEIEKRCVEWRWRIKGRTRRLCQVHGDLHPFNILWQGPLKFKLLDRSRGEWGEAADDVSCLSINYVFWSLMGYNDFRGPFETLYNAVMERYLVLTKDEELWKVIQPFYAFRSLVIANPLFYPNVSYENRRKIFDFMRAVLETDIFEPKEVRAYIKG